jgi:hypothetical protein
MGTFENPDLPAPAAGIACLSHLSFNCSVAGKIQSRSIGQLPDIERSFFCLPINPMRSRQYLASGE